MGKKIPENNKRIGYLADHFFPHVKRGAELETKLLIEEGRRRGYEIVQFEGKIRPEIKDMDFLILGNFVDEFNVGELLGYLTMKPYINMEHDSRACQYPYYKMIATNAAINIFRSPLHRDVIFKFSGKFPNHFLHANCMPKEFRDMGLKRRPETDVLYVGDYCWEKGYKEMLEWLEARPECTIYHYGLGFKRIHPQMVELGQARYEDMPRIYNEFQSLIFLPAYVQACCRIIAESYLCKVCNVITNNLNGFTSYGFTLDQYDEVRDRLINADKIWWNKIEDVMEKWLQ